MELLYVFLNPQMGPRGGEGKAEEGAPSAPVALPAGGSWSRMRTAVQGGTRTRRCKCQIGSGVRMLGWGPSGLSRMESQG